MLIRFLGGAVICATAVGVLSAQSPIPLPIETTQTTIPIPAIRIDVGSPLTTAPSRLMNRPFGYPGTTISNALPALQMPPALAKPTQPAKPEPMQEAAPAPHTPNTHLLANGGCGAIACPPAACAACCDPCGPPGRLWIDAGYWYGTITGQNVPPLVSAAPPGTPRAQAGALGQPNTTVLYPTGKVNDNWRSGFYLNTGLWFDKCQTCGIEGNLFFLGTSRERSVSGSDGTNIVTRPFFNTQNGMPDTQLVSFPNVLAGTVTVDSRSNFIGGGVNFIKNLCCTPCSRFDLLVGYHYMSLEDEINIRENLTSLPGQPNVTPGTQFVVNDNFRTSNTFNGVNIGVSTDRRYSHWYLGARAGVALGNVHQQVDINGSTTITSPGFAPRTFSGGLLAQPSNIGTYERDRFAAIPWLGVRLGLHVTPRIRTYVGYDFMYFSNVVRAGDQIDLRVNPTQIPPRTNGVTGPAFPTFTPRETGAAINAIRFGIEARY